MFKILVLTCISLAILGVAPAKAETNKYTQEQVDQMPRFSSIEQQRCPSARYRTVKKRLECKKEVRIEVFEKRKARENNYKG